MAKSERLVEIETKLAFIEDVMRDIDVRMVEHQKHLERLEIWCQTLAKRMRDQGQNGPSGSGYEVPPHY
ncbi:MAG: SlyX family protein [Pseudomonadota bacterium]